MGNLFLFRNHFIINHWNVKKYCWFIHLFVVLGTALTLRVIYILSGKFYLIWAGKCVLELFQQFLIYLRISFLWYLILFSFHKYLYFTFRANCVLLYFIEGVLLWILKRINEHFLFFQMKRLINVALKGLCICYYINFIS